MVVTFCASGLIKKQRDLNNGEIVAQIMLVQKYFDERGQDERVSHIVVMGIGEPFDNYNNVLNFIRTINDDKGMAIGARHITVSTLAWLIRFVSLLMKESRSTLLFLFMLQTMNCVQAS